MCHPFYHVIIEDIDHASVSSPFIDKFVALVLEGIFVYSFVLPCHSDGT